MIYIITSFMYVRSKNMYKKKHNKFKIGFAGGKESRYEYLETTQVIFAVKSNDFKASFVQHLQPYLTVWWMRKDAYSI